jgi:hypothetical protein
MSDCQRLIFISQICRSCEDRNGKRQEIERHELRLRFELTLIEASRRSEERRVMSLARVGILGSVLRDPLLHSSHAFFHECFHLSAVFELSMVLHIECELAQPMVIQTLEPDEKTAQPRLQIVTLKHQTKVVVINSKANSTNNREPLCHLAQRRTSSLFLFSLLFLT